MSATDRVLVVDDHEAWRGQICSVLRNSSRWQVIGEASDGLEAIDKAKSLAPDLILLDVELPTLSGIEAARQILAANPNLKILFLTLHRCWDIAEAALGTGARGYLLKSDAGPDLLNAMGAVVEGRRFLSAALRGGDADSNTHEAGFYADDAAALDRYARFIELALKAGKAVILVDVEARRRALDRMLKARGLDIDLAVKEGRYLPVEPADFLSEVMVDGWPDGARFWASGTAQVLKAARASKGGRAGVAACGACAGLLAREGKLDAALRLEQLWDELATAYNVDILCIYSRAILDRDEDGRVFRSISAEHTAVHP
jgi:DNA-binding NarL/FixJ family response regulator